MCGEIVLLDLETPKHFGLVAEEVDFALAIWCKVGITVWVF